MSWRSILEFWFGTLINGIAAEEIRERWFVSNPDFDQACAKLCRSTLAEVATLNHWLDQPDSCLAYIILTDQMPRNIFRGSNQAFAFDHLALAAAKQGIERGHDQRLEWDQRAFFYLPYEHSEAILDQHTAVGLFTGLRDQAPKQHRSLMGNSLRFAQQHRDIILRFGRFPHRNEVLGRTSTAEESKFIAEGDGFGQKAT